MNAEGRFLQNRKFVGGNISGRHITERLDSEDGPEKIVFKNCYQQISMNEERSFLQNKKLLGRNLVGRHY